MWKRALLASAIFASAITALFGGEVFAEEGNTATLKNVGMGSQICIYGAQEYEGSLLTADVSNDSFETQVVFGDDSINSGYYRCKKLNLPIGTYSVRLNMPMGIYSFSHSSSREYDTVTFYSESGIGILRYLYSFGSSSTAVVGDEEEQPVDSFPKVFEIAGECIFNKSGKVAGETCVDANGASYAGRDNVDTGVVLFSEENAGKDFEIYFELVSSDSSQNTQGTLFNAKYENSSRYYPGFTFRVVNSNTSKIELTSRLGTSNSSEKKTAEFNVEDLVGKSIKIVRVNGVIKYSIDGGEFVAFDDFSAFTNYFEQTAVFGSSLTSSNGVQRKFNGTIRNMYIKLGTSEAGNGGGDTSPDSNPGGAVKTSAIAPSNTKRTVVDQPVNKKVEDKLEKSTAVELIEQNERPNDVIQSIDIIDPIDEE